jgi:hypothetical protein
MTERIASALHVHPHDLDGWLLGMTAGGGVMAALGNVLAASLTAVLVAFASTFARSLLDGRGAREAALAAEKAAHAETLRLLAEAESRLRSTALAAADVVPPALPPETPR